MADIVTVPEIPATENILYDDYIGTGSGLGQLNIVFEGDYHPRKYELLSVKQDSEEQTNTVLVRTYPDENGNVARRSLMLSADQLIKLAQVQQTERLIFENGEAAAAVDMADLLGGDVQKLIGLIVKGGETISAETLNRDWSMVQTPALSAAELATVKVEIRSIPIKQADGSMAYDISVWLRWGDQELDISAMSPSLQVSLKVVGDNTVQFVVGYQAENTEGFLPLNSTAALILEEIPENQPDEAAKFIVTMPDAGSTTPITIYDADVPLSQEQHSIVTAGYAGKGCYRLLNVE